MKKKIIYINFRSRKRIDPNAVEFMISRFDSPVDLVKFLQDIADKKGEI